MQTVPLSRNYDAWLGLWTAANFNFFFFPGSFVHMPRVRTKLDGLIDVLVIPVWKYGREQTYLWEGNAWSSPHAVSWVGARASENSIRAQS